MTNPLDAWLDRVAATLGVDRDAIERDLVLDLTRDVAHGVSRPAAPLTAFVVGLAAGARGGTAGSVRDAVDAVRALIGDGDDAPKGPAETA